MIELLVLHWCVLEEPKRLTARAILFRKVGTMLGALSVTVDCSCDRADLSWARATQNSGTL